MNWLGHVEHMVEDNNVKKIKRWKPMSKRPTGRTKLCWEDDVLEDIRSMNVCNWKNVTQNRDRQKTVAEQARTLNRLQRFIRRRNEVWSVFGMEYKFNYEDLGAFFFFLKPAPRDIPTDQFSKTVHEL